jgi:hypothetical protein
MTMPTPAQLEELGEMTDAEMEEMFRGMTYAELVEAREMLKRLLWKLRLKNLLLRFTDIEMWKLKVEIWELKFTMLVLQVAILLVRLLFPHRAL